MRVKEPLRLFAGDRLPGFLETDEIDCPRVFATFSAAGAFQEVADLFRKQNRSGTAADIQERMDALDLRIVDPDGHEDRLFTIMIDGQRAMWRVGLLRAAKIASHDSFWKVLGDEVGPQECKEPECSRLKIAQSLFCRRHHFRMIMGEDYEGTLDDA